MRRVRGSSSTQSVRSVAMPLRWNASLISAVDPVATLGAFSALGVEPKLNALIYGESILNDAVAIAAFRVFDSMDGDGFVSAATAGLGCVTVACCRQL